MFKLGSLFTGIGGLDRGLEAAGMTCEWQVEIDEYASKVLQHHWPNVTRIRDVRDADRRNLAQVDCIAGGFPCQDVSEAGRGAGLDGERSGLWSEQLRIICDLRPRYAIVENVTGLLGRGLARVLRDLAEIGYDAEWQVLPAAAFGAPHRRERVFIVAYTPSKRLDTESSETRIFGTPLSQEYCKGQWRGRYVRANGGRIRFVPNSEFCTMAYGTSRGLAEFKLIGNSVVPAVAEYVGRQVLRHAALIEKKAL